MLQFTLKRFLTNEFEKMLALPYMVCSSKFSLLVSLRFLIIYLQCVSLNSKFLLFPPFKDDSDKPEDTAQQGHKDGAMDHGEQIEDHREGTPDHAEGTPVPGSHKRGPPESDSELGISPKRPLHFRGNLKHWNIMVK